MVRNIIINRILLPAVLSESTILHSFKDDVFNSEKVKASYQDKFPVKDIDFIMDSKQSFHILLVCLKASTSKTCIYITNNT